jgi:2-(1,2-epoxy-1,2-dihydrophenyl)acetyl-CoA isomerase
MGRRRLHILTVMQDLLIERDGAVELVTMSRPEKLNAFGPDMLRSLKQYFTEVGSDPDVRVVILTGAGKGFCSGMDVGRLASNLVDAQTGAKPDTGAASAPPAPRLHVAAAIYDCPKPVIAVVNGVAAGGGWGFAMACDIRIASDRASFVAAQVSRGLTLDFGLTSLLTRQVGTQRALEIAWSGRKLSAEEALDLGIVVRVVPHETLLEASLSFAQDLARSAPLAVQAIKRGVYRSLGETLLESLDGESDAVAQLTRTEDFQEGVRSFMEKRPATFVGR